MVGQIRADCPPNTYGTDCELCAPGYAGKNCIACRIGTYAPEPGMELCLACPPGRVSLAMGSIECGPCPPNQRAVGTYLCEACPSGHYVTPNGTCNPCFEGWFLNSDTGLCDLCSIGTYAPFKGMSACISCPEGWYQDGIGASECKPCRINTVTKFNQTDKCVDCGLGLGTYRPGDPECVDQSVLPGGNGRGQSMDLEVTIAMLFTVLGFFWLVGSGELLAVKYCNWEHTKPLPSTNNNVQGQFELSSSSSVVNSGAARHIRKQQFE